MSVPMHGLEYSGLCVKDTCIHDAEDSYVMLDCVFRRFRIGLNVLFLLDWTDKIRQFRSCASQITAYGSDMFLANTNRSRGARLGG
jgi:hypothetical protein